jgi:hypothetical protein
MSLPVNASTPKSTAQYVVGKLKAATLHRGDDDRDEFVCGMLVGEIGA